MFDKHNYLLEDKRVYSSTHRQSRIPILQKSPRWTLIAIKMKENFLNAEDAAGNT